MNVRLPQIERLVHSDGYVARVRWWLPERLRGAVLYFHGIQSHGGWYEASGARLAECGLAVLMPDRRGSGLNREQRGHAACADRLLDDAADLLRALRERTSRPAAHLVGISWGGKLAAAVASQRPSEVASLTLVAPGLYARIDLTAPEKFRVAMAFVNDRERRFPIPLNDPRLFTANPARVAYVEADDLKLVEVSAAFLVASRRLDRLAHRLGRSDYRGPVHLLLAGRDRIIENEPTRRWLRELPSPDRQITEYPDAEHTLEFESDPTVFFDDLTSWLRERCGSDGPLSGR